MQTNTLPTQRTRQWSLGALLAVAFTVLSLLLTASLTLFSDRAASDQVRKGIGDNLAELAQQTTSRMDRAMFERYREVRLIADRVNTVTDPAVVRQTLEAVQKSYPYYAWIGVADTSGLVLAATGGTLEGENVSTRPWYRDAMADRSVGHVHDAALLAQVIGRMAGEPQRFVDIAFPMVDAATDSITGVVGAKLSWQWANDIQEAVFASVNLHRQVDMLIVSTNGTVLLGPRELQGVQLKLPSLEAAARGESGYSKEKWADGKTYLVGYSRDHGFDAYPGLQWRVLVRQTLDAAYAPVDGLHKRLLIGGLVAAVLFSLLGWLLARLVTRPLQELTDVARGIEAGYAVKAPHDPPYREVALLGSAFNSLVAGLQDKEAELRLSYAAQERRVSERTAELRAALDEVQANEERVQSIIGMAQEAFIGMDFEGIITDWNAEAEKLLGWRRHEVMGESLADVVLPERFQTTFVQALAGFLTTGRAPFTGHPMRRTVVHRNGQEMDVEMKIGLINTAEVQLFSAFVRPVSNEPRASEN